jgi:hypothetical protein
MFLLPAWGVSIQILVLRGDHNVHIHSITSTEKTRLRSAVLARIDSSFGNLFAIALAIKV